MSDKETTRHSLVGPPELWQMKREFQISFLVQAGLEPHHRFCDLGCGTLRGGIPIIKYLDAGCYFGCEVRAEAVKEACEELAEHNQEVKSPMLLMSRQFLDVTLSHRFDFIWAFSVLFHLDDETLDRTVGFCARHLAPRGVLYANVNLGENNDGTWREFAFVARELPFYSECCRRHGLIVSDLGPLNILGHVTGIQGQDEQRMLKITRFSEA